MHVWIKQSCRGERASQLCLCRAEAHALLAVGGQRLTAAWVPGFGAYLITRWVPGCTGPGLHSLCAFFWELAL